MPLKVLLADDSAAIKKVVQLSLQDYGVELKAVGSGKDVLDVALQFRPDIAFVDVLLPHKTGYEVVAEMKKDNALKKIPVVMLWSAFMAFDEGKYKSSGADEKLEKPFEVAGLRALVTKLVPKAQPSPLSKHLDFPKVDFAQPIGAVPPAKGKQAKESKSMPPGLQENLVPPSSARPSPSEASASVPPPIPKEEWSMASFEDISAYATPQKIDDEKTPTPPQVSELSQITSITTAPTAKAPANTTTAPADANVSAWAGDNEWVRKDLGKFKVPIPEEHEDDGSVPFKYTENEVTDTSFLFKPQSGGQTPPHEGSGQSSGHGSEITQPAKSSPPLPSHSSISNPAAPLSMGPLPEAVVEELKQEARDIIERVAWKLIPELASQIIRDELQRLLGDET